MNLNKNKIDWNLAFTMGICIGVWTTLVYLITA
jgi:hypothetical protein